MNFAVDRAGPLDDRNPATVSVCRRRKDRSIVHLAAGPVALLLRTLNALRNKPPGRYTDGNQRENRANSLNPCWGACIG